MVINNDSKSYEFIGLFKLSKKGCKVIKDTFIQLNNNYQPNQKFENSKSWREAYLTDFFQHIIRNKISKINSHVISKCWAEFDTREDYGRLEYIKKIQKLSI